MTNSPELQAGLNGRFPDLHPPLDRQSAVIEANRCLNCFDAPCTVACPTHIDVPRFIKKIASGNLMGSAHAILEANVLGASCARVCPVAVLCEGACVMKSHNESPIAIGRLQRHAMDEFQFRGGQLVLRSSHERTQRVACIGAGPASLACAAELRTQGYQVTVFESRDILGGLNTYGVAEYKLTSAESLKEVDMIRALGVEFRMGERISSRAQIAELDSQFEAVFVGVGLGPAKRLDLPGGDMEAVVDAIKFIESYKRGLVDGVEGRVLVIGAGNTAIDAAIASRRLGASEVTILSRRTESQMSAFSFEYEHAKLEGVKFHWLVLPVAVRLAEDGTNILRCARTELSADGRVMTGAGSDVSLPFDLLISAIGQSPLLDLLSVMQAVELADGRVVVDERTGQTSNPKFYAGGDCVNGGREVVDAVAEGKRAAIAIAKALEVRA
jgi:dihydropyrimidine dehydrogenase (NAD+) subunit PreT